MTILDALLARLAAGPHRHRRRSPTTPSRRPAPTTATRPTQRAAIVADQRDRWRACREARSIAFVDIFDISLQRADDRSLVAADGLHPSGAQYALWVERIGPVVEALLTADRAASGHGRSHRIQAVVRRCHSLTQKSYPERAGGTTMPTAQTTLGTHREPMRGRIGWGSPD